MHEAITKLTAARSATSESRDHVQQIAAAAEQQSTVSADLAQMITRISADADQLSGAMDGVLKIIKAMAAGLESQLDVYAEWPFDEVLLSVAMCDHVLWIEKATDYLSTSQEDYQSLADHRKCRLGKWMNEVGRERFGEKPVYQKLERLHRRVHETGQELADLASHNQQEAAQQKVNALIELRQDVLETLQTLRQEVMGTG